ncbi:MAG: type II secretion system protein [Patescibacteria group bacterium]|nr:type II secretion system protein [Patescibacteria group bacterium]
MRTPNSHLHTTLHTSLSLAHTGFTLIELMVVVSIIGLLASIILSSMNGAKSRARDAQRIVTVDQFAKTLQSCYMSTNNNYPHANNIWDAVGSGAEAGKWMYNESCGCNTGNFINALSPCIGYTIMDPVNQGSQEYFYFYFAPTATTYQGTPVNANCRGHYALMADLENKGYANYADPQNGCFHQAGNNEFWRVMMP